MAKRKKTEIQKFREKLDKVFSIFIRTRNADENGYVKCFTCSTVDHWKSVDCGHFQSRRHNSTRWDEKNCQVQCKGCNIFRQGEQFKFAKALDEKFGKGAAEKLEIKSRNTCKFSRFEYELLIQDYEQKIKNTPH